MLGQVHSHQGAEGLQGGSFCILSFNLTTNKTNEPPGSTQRASERAALGRRKNTQDKWTSISQTLHRELFYQNRITLGWSVLMVIVTLISSDFNCTPRNNIQRTSTSTTLILQKHIIYGHKVCPVETEHNQNLKSPAKPKLMILICYEISHPSLIVSNSNY